MKESIREIGAYLLLLTVLGAIVFLAHTGVINGEAAVGILTSIVTLAGGALAVHTGVKAGADAAANGKTKE